MIEKIDVIENAVYCYNEKYDFVKTLDLSQFSGIDFKYLEGSKLFTLNVSKPIKRAVKFTEINSFDT